MNAEQKIKERPILFSREMVEAILHGNKTQTRRIVKYPAIRNKFPMHIRDDIWGWGTKPRDGNQACRSEDVFKCPYGNQVDQLWVRETFGITKNINNIENWPDRPHRRINENTVYIYKADGYWNWCDEDGETSSKSFWKPSIHMPRIASRITLEINNVRVEKLNEISASDAEAEGIQFMRDIPDADEMLSPTQLFEVLWESINGPDSWKLNPWVWVIEFSVA
ncbi:hypothetical protein LEP1GSC161_0285 [Leptospira santarosai str. CBC1416]|uniref:Morphogenetic protein n=1 Tax=Leptospira santarosai str. CBC1416 TaxID=1193059 RepID=M6VSC5_9LEPT|nr:hypothetical protein LEP1GSC161_0285 [Leptospira santarosai str. CBC1416]